MVQSLAVPKPDSSLSAVVVSGGKQYRVAPGDRILVDRLSAEPGSSLKLGRVLLLRNGDDITVGSPAVDGRVLLDGDVRELRQWDVVRVAPEVVRAFEAGPEGLEIIAVGGFTGETKTKTETATDAKPKAKAKAPAKPRARAAAKAEVAAPVAEDKPAKRAPRKKETK